MTRCWRGGCDRRPFFLPPGGGPWRVARGPWPAARGPRPVTRGSRSPEGGDPAERVPQGDGAGPRVLELGERWAQGVADRLLAGCLGGAGTARGAEQGADRLVHVRVPPVADDLAAAVEGQAGGYQGRLQVAGSGEGIGGVIARPFGRNERGHGLVR